MRVPPPLISRRLPSGRGATGVAAGLFGSLITLILFSVQHIAFGYHTGSLEDAVEHASDVRRLVVLLWAGVFGGVALVPAPLAGLVLILELTRGGFSIAIPMIAATVAVPVQQRHAP